MQSAASSAGQSLRPVLQLLGVWLVMAFLAVLNGGFRETVLVSRLGQYRAHVLSTALLVTLIVVVIYSYFAATDVTYTRGQLLAIGAGWTVLTVGFEFLVGFLEGTPPSVTVGQYNVFAGQVWIAVPLTLLFAPLVIGGWVMH